MATRELTRAPRLLPLYLRTAATLLPGASHLPGVPGGGNSMPAIELTLADARGEPRRLAAYSDVCGFTNGAVMPCTYPHVLAFPLHMALMTDPHFPFPAIGLVHVENRIDQLRPLGTGEPLTLAVSASPPEPHARGRTFAILTSAHVGDELVWSERSTMLRRGRSEAATANGAAERAATPAQPGSVGGEGTTSRSQEASTVLARTRWSLPGDLGRRYGAVSGDRNPIHLHPLAAKALGFPRAIAHGMWMKARCLAALEQELPEAFSVSVRFRKPVLIPGSVSYECNRVGETIGFVLRSETREETHLSGWLDERPPGAQLRAGGTR
jgi:acyl dehydratase